MRRTVNLEEVTDGRRYGLNDLVKADCQGCKDCSDCCHGMGNSIVLDPYDAFILTLGTDKTFEMLINTEIELNVVDGIILPNLKMNASTNQCSFLNEKGRCSIHAYRPGICRMFPLGRIYEDGSFEYILQTKECPKENKTKIKVRKWIDVKDTKQNDEFILLWHYFLKELQEKIASRDDPQYAKTVSMIILSYFYQKSFTSQETFYEEFHQRLQQSKEILL